MNRTDTTKPPLHRDIDWLTEEYVINGRSVRDIGKQCGVTHQAISIFVVRYGLAEKKGAIHGYHKWSKIGEQFLRDEYGEKLRSHIDIANELNMSESTVRKACRIYGINRLEYPIERLSHAERLRRNVEYQNHKYATDPRYRKMKADYSARWRKEHPDEFNAYQRKYCDEHRDKINARNKARYHAKKMAEQGLDSSV